jgi:hypothetical protein
MQRANVVALRGVVGAVVKERGLSFTPTAAEMLYNIVDAVTRDPHATWSSAQKDSAELDKFQREMIEKLQDQLMTMPVLSKAGVISTFDLLHAASGIIEWLCPFKKVPQ